MSIRRRVRHERGAELIEMALVLPLLMLIIMGIMDFGFLFREMSVVTNAAREGARAGILPTNIATLQPVTELYLLRNGEAHGCVVDLQITGARGKGNC